MESSSPVNASSQKSDSQGKLKIFFGAVPGVGKSLALLEAGRKRLTDGWDVTVGMVDSKERSDIQALVTSFETIPTRSCFKAGQQTEEFDLDAALERKPDLILLSDLGHQNAEGARHKKRWQDIEELLGAGIDVYTAMDVFDLDSQKDLITQITGISVKDSVPDAVFERADEIQLVDASPDELLQRLSDGKIALLKWSEKEKEQLFNYGSLLALRELTLRKAAERIDDQMTRHRSAQGVRTVWPATERILVCVGPNPRSDRLIRAARRMAKGLRVSWIALHVEAPSPILPSSEDLLRLEEHMRLAERLGAETVSLQGRRAGEIILDFARARNVSKIIVGKPTHPRWKDRLFGSLLDEIVRGSEGIEVYVITGDTPTETRPSAAIRSRSPLRPKPWLLATLSVFGCFSLARLMMPVFAMADLVMVFLLGIVLVAARWGMGPSFLATLLSIALFDFFFVPPFHTFAVSEHGYLITFGVMFLVAIVISRLTARVREQADAARLREQRTAALYGLSRDLVHERTLPELATVASRHIGEGLVCRVTVFVPNETGKLTPLANPEWDAADVEGSRVAEWVFRHRKPAGMGTDTHAHANGLFFPLLATSGPVGVLGLWRDENSNNFTPEQLHLLEGLAGQTAQAMERVILAEEAQSALVAAERESLRSTLLSSVSHDLRTPLAAITGAGNTLLRNDHLLDAVGREELLQTIVEEAAHLNRIIRNVLDMTRLESGAIQVNREWQSLEEIVGAVTNRMSGQFHDHPLSIKLPPDLPLIPCDGLLIEQVLRNLLENAVKYTPDGTAITLSAIAEEQEVLVTVADRGYGIPPEEAGLIFEKFVRGKHAGGVGLGLAICRGMVTAHGGRIWVENPPEGGALFTFTLPTAQTPPPVEQEVEESVG